MRDDVVARMMEEVGDSIRRLRLQRNLSQETVAERSGISFGAYRHLESGEGTSFVSRSLPDIGKDRLAAHAAAADDQSDGNTQAREQNAAAEGVRCQKGRKEWVDRRDTFP